MKKYRPYKAGFIVLYVLFFLCLSDAAYTLVCQITGRGNEYMQSFSLFSYLIAILAVLYVKMYGATRVEISNKTFRFVNPVYIKPEAGAKRAMFIYRQGDTDIKLVDKRFQLDGIVRYGYIEDLGYSKLDKSGAGEGNKLFPVHEVAFVMNDGKRYHMNAGSYKDKQLTAMLEQIYAATELAPEGKLANLLPAAK